MTTTIAPPVLDRPLRLLAALYRESPGITIGEAAQQIGLSVLATIQLTDRLIAGE